MSRKRSPASRSRRSRVLAYLASVLALAPGQTWSRDLALSSLEELMNIEVTSVSRKDQRVSATAAAVYVVTAEDIRRSGATNIPEVLRMVPGVQVAQIDSNKWAISARGFNGRFANKMLVLIDGRSIYNNIYSGVFWDQYDLLLEDVERVEVIRGPGATMWGANAVNGVINIITKAANDTTGVLVSSTVGNTENANARVRYGGKAGDNIAYRVWGKYFNRGPSAKSDGSPGNDRGSMTGGGGRMDWQLSKRDLLTVHGNVYEGFSNQMVFPNFPASFMLPPAEDQVDTSGGYALARWERKVSDRSDFALQWYLDDLRRSEYYAHGRGQAMDFDFQHRYALSEAHDLMWGAGFRRLTDRIRPGLAAFVPESRTDEIYSTFLQDEIKLRKDLVLTGGLKVQHNDYTGWELQPSIRLLWLLDEKRSFWTAASRALRVPARFDHDGQVHYVLPPVNGMPVQGFFSGTRESVSEELHSLEMGYRQQVNRRFSFDTAIFFNNYQDLQSATSGVPILAPGPSLIVPATYTNGGAGNTYGAEVATTTQVTNRWQVAANYSWFGDSVSFPGGWVPQLMFDAHHRAHARSYYNLTPKLDFDLSGYYVSKLKAGVDSYVRLDSRLAYRISEHLGFALVGQNLLNKRHLEFVPEDYTVPFQIRRAVYLKATWQF